MYAELKTGIYDILYNGIYQIFQLSIQNTTIDIKVLLKGETLGDTLTGIRRTRYFELGKSIFEFGLTLGQRDHTLEKTIE